MDDSNVLWCLLKNAMQKKREKVLIIGFPPILRGSVYVTRFYKQVGGNSWSAHSAPKQNVTSATEP